MRIARVVPDLPTYAVDEGFRYATDQPLAVGSVVRVPLGRRVVRGWVVGVEHGEPSALKQIKALSAEVPIFTEELLQTLRWAAHHYVAPLAALLRRAGPPNLPGRVDTEVLPPVTLEARKGLAAPISAAVAGRRARAVYSLVGRDDLADALLEVGPVLGSGGSAMVIMATGAEVATRAALLREAFGTRVIEVPPEASHREVTAAWDRACQTPGHVVVGTHRIEFWPIEQLRLAVIVEEGRRAMRDRQTPTIHAREVIRRRASVERFNVMYLGSVPSTTVLAAGVEVQRRSTRGWPPVEIVDRTEDPPGSGLFAQRVRSSIAGALRRDVRVFVFSHRRGYAPAFRCVGCKTLRRCPSCGSRPEPGDACSRCGAELGPCPVCGGKRFEPLGAGVGRISEVLRRAYGDKAVGAVGSEAPIWVGTERDIPSVAGVGLGVVGDADGLILGSAYNAAEEALRIFARLAVSIPFGSGRHLIVQTGQPDHPVIAALRSGDPLPFLEGELRVRQEFGLPPSGEVIVVEVDGGTRDASAALQAAVEAGATLLGPAERAGKLRWLIQGRDLSDVRSSLRQVAQTLRDGGAAVRLDVDPLDL
ncbi:MAG: hypothetical protein GWP04_04075 [Gammaproteobacteria bacterium]|nr:hypothetical protein [Gammaproteobacteria bacterium]